MYLANYIFAEFFKVDIITTNNANYINVEVSEIDVEFWKMD